MAESERAVRRELSSCVQVALTLAVLCRHSLMFLHLSLAAVLLLSGPFTQALSDEDELYLKTFSMHKARNFLSASLVSHSAR